MFTTREVIGFCADKTDVGYSWTLTSFYGHLLRDAQEKFGARNLEYTPIGIEFHGDYPQTWFPENCGNVSILLSEKSRSQPRRALFQLAHEVIHILSPQPGARPAKIEEGLATFYSHEISRKYHLHMTSNVEAYAKPEALVTRMLTERPDAIKVLREETPSFHAITPDAIMRCVRCLSRTEAEFLCEPFPHPYNAD